MCHPNYASEQYDQHVRDYILWSAVGIKLFHSDPKITALDCLMLVLARMRKDQDGN